MVIDSYSFLKNILGRNTYNEFKEYAKVVVPIGTCVLVVLVGLSMIVHWNFVSSLLSLVTGTSLLFIAYVVGVVLLLDRGVDVVLEKDWNGCYNFPTTKPQGYKRTVVWGIFLICIGIGSIYATNKYRKHYAFECDSFLVDENKGIYHLDGYNDDCDEIDDSYDLIRMKGFEIEEKGYTFCASCEIWVEEAETDYESDRYYRR